MDLSETVVQPRRAHVGRHSLGRVRLVNRQQAVDLRGDLLGRAVLMDLPVGAGGVVGAGFELPVPQLDLALPAEHVDPGRDELLAGHELVELPNQGCGEGALAGDGIEEPVDGFGVVLDHAGDEFRRVVGCVARDQRGVDALLDQQLRGAPIECVETLDDPGLDGPLTLETLVEVVHLHGVEFAANALPHPRQWRQFLAGRGAVGLRQVDDRLPAVADLCFIHPQHRTHSRWCRRASRRVLKLQRAPTARRAVP